MRILYYHTLSPFARKVRVTMHEKHLEFEERIEKDWLQNDEFMAVNPAGEVPALAEENGTIVADSAAICEYLEEVYAEPTLIGETAKKRAETRRLVGWFDCKFHREVTCNLAGQKLVKRVTQNAAPDSRALREGRENIHIHLSYISWLLERRTWLAGDAMTLADIAAASHLSLVDYTGDVPWEDHYIAKDWYARIKSRPSFRSVLGDSLDGIPAAPVYADLDF